MKSVKMDWRVWSARNLHTKVLVWCRKTAHPSCSDQKLEQETTKDPMRLADQIGAVVYRKMGQEDLDQTCRDVAACGSPKHRAATMVLEGRALALELVASTSMVVAPRDYVDEGCC